MRKTALSIRLHRKAAGRRSTRDALLHTPPSDPTATDCYFFSQGDTVTVATTGADNPSTDQVLSVAYRLAEVNEPMSLWYSVLLCRLQVRLHL